MGRRAGSCGLAVLLAAVPARAQGVGTAAVGHAAEFAHGLASGPPPGLPWGLPFLGLLLSIALLPAVAPRFWTRRMGLVSLALVVMLKVTHDADRLAREDLAFALAVVLLGLLMMVTRRNAVSQVVGFMSLENGLVLAATGAKGMPLVVEISVAFSILIAFIVIGIFLFRIRERFDTVDLQALDRFRGERR